MSIWKNYIIPLSVEEAVHALVNSPAPTRLVGGGTDLLLEMQQGHHDPVHTLVDVTRIPELLRLESTHDSLIIGAALPVKIITDSPLVKHHAKAVSEACGLIGGPQVRNTATLGGNVAHALPAADGMISLYAFDAAVEIASPAGRRIQPISSLFKGPGQSTLNPCSEILVKFILPLRKPGQSSAFSRVMRPQGVALPVLNMAVWMEREQDYIKDIHIVYGPSGPVPTRAAQVEEIMRGNPLDKSVLERAKKTIHQSIRFRTSAMRASSIYRYHLSEVLLDEVIGKAWQRTHELEVA
ncbi:MAG: FAD binding domain-containing protein [Chloroflexota bacterium]|jgi:carbon-monoxide dehydrogenase medium subunit